MLAVWRRVWQDGGMNAYATIALVITASMVVYLAVSRNHAAKRADDVEPQCPWWKSRIGVLPFLGVFVGYAYCSYALLLEGLLLLGDDAAGYEHADGSALTCLVLFACTALWWIFFGVAYMRRLHDMGFHFGRSIWWHAVLTVILALIIRWVLGKCGAPDFMIESASPAIVYIALVLGIGVMPGVPVDNLWGEYKGDESEWGSVSWMFCKSALVFLGFLALHVLVCTVMLAAQEQYVAELKAMG